MKLQYLNSATVLIKTETTKVLCDPWLKDGAYYGSWCHYPNIEQDINIDDYLNVDYIYISHVHPDHLHIDTLKNFPKNIPILIHEYQHKFVYNILNSIGFSKIIQVPHKREFSLSDDLKIEILAADDCNPEKCGLFIGCKVMIKNTKSLSIDSLAVFKSKDSVLVNTNDCPFELATDVTKYIKNKYNKVDMLLVGYLGAGPYPQCFENLTFEEKKLAADSKKHHFYSQAVSFISSLKPKYFMPFAGKYTLAGKLVELNKWRGNPDMEQVVKELPELLMKKQITSEMIVLDREDEIDILDRGITSNFTPIKASEREKYIKEVLSKNRFSYDYDEEINHSELKAKLHIAQEKKIQMQKIFNFYSDWLVYLDTNKDYLIEIPYNNDNIKFVDKVSKKNPWVKIGLSSQALSSTLLRKTHWNNLEIGSHLSFLRSRNEYVRGIHYFLNFFHS